MPQGMVSEWLHTSQSWAILVFSRKTRHIVGNQKQCGTAAAWHESEYVGA